MIWAGRVHRPIAKSRMQQDHKHSAMPVAEGRLRDCSAQFNAAFPLLS